MTAFNKIKIGLFIFLLIFVSNGNAQEKLKTVQWNSKESAELRKRIPVNADFWRLVPSFSGQRNQAFCGVATAVTVLNAMAIEKPVDPIYYPYSYFTQDNFFSPDVLKIIAPQRVLGMGITREELARSIETHGVKVKSIPGDSISEKELRELLIDVLVNDNKFIIVNYLRTEVGQKGYGHWSALASYDSGTDLVLILDVEKYKYLPLWVDVGTLKKAINTIDSTSKKPRGLIIVSE